ncbi:MAG TPA: ferritin-like domain-containing protein [Acidobacteriaceae bacterium]|jgi:hypothetical protein|nr:ferritin-like domain-containing protein [Acidobacteriaceae bacterium]
MATQETQQIDAILSSRRAMLAMGGTALAGLALSTVGSKAEAQSTSTFTDTDILNFALNLEYLEANFYTLAAAGATIDQSAGGSLGIGAGTSTTGGGAITVKSGGPTACKVPFTMPLIQAYALEVALEERNHVTTLRSALGSSAVAQPVLDLVNSFVTLGNAVGVSNFDPFANDLAFLLGSYIFEDVGVSAYHGAAPLITNKTSVLAPAVGIHAVEAYHAGLVRATIFNLDQTATALGPAGTLRTLSQKISAARATLDGTASKTPDDIGVGTVQVALQGTTANFPASTLADADTNYLGWARTPTQVLAIVYAGGSGKGGFFPNGLNGNIK